MNSTVESESNRIMLRQLEDALAEVTELQSRLATSKLRNDSLAEDLAVCKEERDKFFEAFVTADRQFHELAAIQDGSLKIIQALMEKVFGSPEG